MRSGPTINKDGEDQNHMSEHIEVIRKWSLTPAVHAKPYLVVHGLPTGRPVPVLDNTLLVPYWVRMLAK